MSTFLIVLISAQYKLGHTSNQCFHHSFLEASSFFSILPLVILSSWKRLLSHCYSGASILGLRVATPRFWAGGSQGGLQEGRWSRGRVVKYYYILSCSLQEVCSKVVTFEEKWNNNLPRGSCKWTIFCLENRFFLIA